MPRAAERSGHRAVEGGPQVGRTDGDQLHIGSGEGAVLLWRVRLASASPGGARRSAGEVKKSRSCRAARGAERGGPRVEADGSAVG